MDITGTAEADTLLGTDEADLIFGRMGDDILKGAQGADTLYGNRGNDMLYGQRGDDILVGGRGDDILDGGRGADTFVFRLTTSAVTGGTASFSSWLQEQGKEPLSDGVTTQGQFSSSYSAWLSATVARFSLGEDVDGDGTVSVELNQNSPTGSPLIEGLTAEESDALFSPMQSLTVKTGNTTHERWYSDTLTVPDTVDLASRAGHDTVADFSVAEGDKLSLAGVTAADFAALVSVQEQDANGDLVMDTVIAAEGDASWSITLLGVTGFDAAQHAVFV
jgi:Ca2+-binding RTX toxin-like protein